MERVNRFQKYYCSSNRSWANRQFPHGHGHTAHDEFRTQEFKDFLKECNKLKVLFDGQNVYKYEELPKNIYYLGVGRPLKTIIINF